MFGILYVTATKKKKIRKKIQYSCCSSKHYSQNCEVGEADSRQDQPGRENEANIFLKMFGSVCNKRSNKNTLSDRQQSQVRILYTKPFSCFQTRTFLVRIKLRQHTDLDS